MRYEYEWGSGMRPVFEPHYRMIMNREGVRVRQAAWVELIAIKHNIIVYLPDGRDQPPYEEGVEYVREIRGIIHSPAYLQLRVTYLDGTERDMVYCGAPFLIGWAADSLDE